MKKILIIYASAGDGHKKAAEAIYKGFLELGDSQIQAMPIDALNYTTRFFKFTYRRIYIVLIKYIPWLWGFFYHISNNRFFYFLARPFRFLTNRLSSRRLEELVVKEKFDIIISTHFFPTEVISHLKYKGILDLPLINLVTDFRFHLFWIAKRVDKYLVSAESTKRELIARGIDSERIEVCGMPVRKKFSHEISKEQARSDLDIAKDRFTILVMGGGLGVGPILEIVIKLQSFNYQCQIIAVCGHNKTLLSQLNQLKKDLNKETKIFGFCHNIDMIMSASDIIISKVGGITASESLIKGLPIVAVRPIPGQEMGNMSFLLEYGVGFQLKAIDDLNSLLEELIPKIKDTDNISKKIQKIAKPLATDNVINLILDTIR